MIRNSLISVVYLLVTLAHADLNLAPKADAIIDDFLNQRYRNAKESIRTILADDPQNIDVLFMYLNVYQIELVDYESYILHGREFLTSVDSVITVFEKHLAKNAVRRDSAKCLFYLGTTHLMKALVLAKVEEWLPAVRYAMSASKQLKRAQALDTTLYEACYGLGLYNYYVGQSFRWVPFVKDKYEQGLAEIVRVANSPSPMSYMAKNSIAWIYIEQEKYAKADSAIASALRQYPDNTIFLRIKARVELLRKNYNEGAALGRRLAELSGQRDPVNWSDLMDGYQVVVASLDAMGKKKECLGVIRTVEGLNIPCEAKKIEYVQSHLDYIMSTKGKYEK